MNDEKISEAKFDWSKPMFKNNRYENPSGTFPKGFKDLFKWVVLEKRAKWQKKISSKSTAQLKTKLEADQFNCVMVNHASLLIQLPEGNLLTDPVFSQRTSPFQWIGPSRHQAPGLKLQELPPIHFVLVSHNHYDHMDMDSLRSLWKEHDPVFLLPLHNSRFLRDSGIHSQKIQELNWWESCRLGDNFRAVLTPAQHWSFRSHKDRNHSLWGGFWIDNGKSKIFFAGDTGCSNHFDQIREPLGTPNLSLLPIGAYEPRWFMKEQHMNPEDAVKAHLDLESQYSVAIHWGTWQLTNEGMEDPVKALGIALNQYQVSPEKFRVLGNGEIFFL